MEESVHVRGAAGVWEIIPSAQFFYKPQIALKNVLKIVCNIADNKRQSSHHHAQ